MQEASNGEVYCANGVYSPTAGVCLGQSEIGFCGDDCNCGFGEYVVIAEQAQCKCFSDKGAVNIDSNVLNMCVCEPGKTFTNNKCELIQ